MRFVWGLCVYYHVMCVLYCEMFVWYCVTCLWYCVWCVCVWYSVICVCVMVFYGLPYNFNFMNSLGHNVSLHSFVILVLTCLHLQGQEAKCVWYFLCLCMWYPVMCVWCLCDVCVCVIFCDVCKILCDRITYSKS